MHFVGEEVNFPCSVQTNALHTIKSSRNSGAWGGPGVGMQSGYLFIHDTQVLDPHSVKQGSE